MKNKTFTHEKYGKKNTFHVGQKVECTYYHEYIYEKKSYKRKWWQLFDKPFKPVKLGLIVGDAGNHPYWLSCAYDGKEQYLFVKFKEYLFAKAIPISCIRDSKESAESLERFLKENLHRLGEKGYDFESFEALTRQARNAKHF